MRTIVVAAAVAALGGMCLGPVAARADYVWHLYNNEDEPSAFLAVVDADSIEEPQNHFPFSMLCSGYSDWLMVVSDVEAKALGENIAGGDQPSFAFILDGEQGSDEYYPSISLSDEGIWEYTTSWDYGVLDQLSGASEIGVSGVGVDMTLPTEGKAEAFEAFKTACEGIENGGGDDMAPEDQAPGDGSN